MAPRSRRGFDAGFADSFAGVGTVISVAAIPSRISSDEASRDGAGWSWVRGLFR